MTLTIYHNPRCSKSRQTLNLIKDSGVEVDVVPYLISPPSAEELDLILTKLALEPEQIVRTGEALYKSEYKGKKFSREEWISILVQNPILIERPIVVKGMDAVMGRPPENVQKLL